MTATDELGSKADLATVRASIRSSALEVEERHLADLERVDAGPGRMAAPERQVKVRSFTNATEYRNTQASDYDWFYGLSKAEQGRLRENWFSDSPTAQAPDEVFAKISQRDWLEQTRIVDASRAIAAGRAGQYNPKRYGGLNPNHLIEDQPYDVRQVYNPDEEKARRHVAKGQGGRSMGRTWRERVWGEEPDRSRCQFFTDENGIVHPIRATCPPEGQTDTPREYTAEELEEF